MKTLRRVKLILLILILCLIPVSVFLTRQIAMILSVFVAVCMVVVLRYDLHMILNPLIRIRDSIKEKRLEETLQQIEWSEESTDVGNVFLDVVNYYTSKQDAEIYSRQIELAALQSQINPHFLYNTLDAIRGQAIQENNREVAMMIQTLSAFFRYSISRKGNAVTLRDELDNVQNYMKIQQYRFGDRFQLELEVDDPEAYDYYVPRLIFQISRRQFGEAEPANPKGLSPCETTGSNPVATTREPNRKVRLISQIIVVRAAAYQRASRTWG